MRILLPLAFLLLANTAFGATVDPDSPDGIAAVFYDADTLYLLNTEGFSYAWRGAGNGWTGYIASLPIPIVEVRDWSKDYVLSNDGRLFEYFGAEWSEITTMPNGVVASDGEPLGGVRAMFK